MRRAVPARESAEENWGSRPSSSMMGERVGWGDSVVGEGWTWAGDGGASGDVADGTAGGGGCWYGVVSAVDFTAEDAVLGYCRLVAPATAREAAFEEELPMLCCGSGLRVGREEVVRRRACN
jgi:hypothetical protein